MNGVRARRASRISEERLRLGSARIQRPAFGILPNALVIAKMPIIAWRMQALPNGRHHSIPRLRSE